MRSPTRPDTAPEPGAVLRLFVVVAALALALAVAAGCATRGVSTRALESKPVVRCYEKNCSDAEDSRSAAQGGCPTCVY
jgi:hypothetical protein